MPNESGVTTDSEPRQITILVIDDDELVRQSLGAILGVHGLKVLFAVNGQTGLQAFQTHHHEVDVILLDITLPDMAGEFVFKIIRELNPQIPVVVMSGYSESSIAPRFPADSNIQFLSKPAPIHEMIAKINRLLGKG